MKRSQFFIPTLKEIPSEASLPSHILMLRAGLIRKLSSGFYTYLPLGLKVLKKVENIIRQEMDVSGANEFSFPLVLPKELWEKTGRWGLFKKELFRLKDRDENDFSLAPTHEEAFTMLAKQEINSYKVFPFNFYQIHTKFRDEIRPRFGVIRSREFMMKDAYSFHLSVACLEKMYLKMIEVYKRIFKRFQLDFLNVKADSGAMGGSGSEEFVVKSDVGEETVLTCSSCEYVANAETAEESIFPINKTTSSFPSLEKIATPKIKTIKELSDFLKINPYELIKSYVCSVNDSQEKKIILILIRGDYEVNEKKLANLFPNKEIVFASDELIKKTFNTPPGYLGPLNLSKEIEIIADTSIQGISHAIVGANEEGFHYKNACLNRDFLPARYVDLYQARENGKCILCDSSLKMFRGIEIGHVFKLGEKYTKAFDFSVLDENGNQKTPIMGCYGIGLNRTMAAIIEQYHDKDGICWPKSVAPYQICLLSLDMKDASIIKASENLYRKLKEKSYCVLWDDRFERVGVKFKDADLLGIPLQIVVGKKNIAKNIFELKIRKPKQSFEYQENELLAQIEKHFKS